MVRGFIFPLLRILIFKFLIMRRVILIDLEEAPNFVSLYSYGGSFEVYSIQQLEGSTQEEKLAALTLGNGDAAMLVGSKPFDYLKELYHFGISSENYFDCSKLFIVLVFSGICFSLGISFSSFLFRMKFSVSLINISS